MTIKKFFQILCCTIIVLLTSTCTTDSVSPTKEDAFLLTPIPMKTTPSLQTPSPEPTMTETVIPTSSPVLEQPIQNTPVVNEVSQYYRDLIDPETLPPGQYMVFHSYADSALMAMSFQGKLYPIFSSNLDFTYSKNARYLISLDQNVINIFDQRIEFNTNKDDNRCISEGVSGNGVTVLPVFCEVMDGVSVYHKSTGLTPLFSGSDLYDGGDMPSISNQGNMVSYCAGGRSGYNVFSGTKFVEIGSCYEDASCHPMEARLPFCAQHGAAWHPNGKWAAAIDDDYKLHILSLVTGETQIIEGEYSGFIEKDMAWSPDGNWLLFNGDYRHPTDTSAFRMFLYLYSVQTGEIQIIDEQTRSYYDLAGWLNIHSAFHEGARYRVLPREDKLYLRSTAGPEGEPVYQLLENDVITILDQSQEIDQAKWWLVESNYHQGWLMETADFFQDDWRYGLMAPEFKLESRLIVTDAGNDLRLRQTPELEGEIIRKLQPGVRLTIIAGPVITDGYTWWQISLDESNLTGWVAEDSTWFASFPEE